jgi:hypothetical protein
MISSNELDSLDFDYNWVLERHEFKDIIIEFDSEFQSGIKICLNGFELSGIRDVRDLRKLIELVYGK